MQQFEKGVKQTKKFISANQVWNTQSLVIILKDQTPITAT